MFWLAAVYFLCSVVPVLWSCCRIWVQRTPVCCCWPSWPNTSCCCTRCGPMCWRPSARRWCRWVQTARLHGSGISTLVFNKNITKGNCVFSSQFWLFCQNCKIKSSNYLFYYVAETSFHRFDTSLTLISWEFTLNIFFIPWWKQKNRIARCKLRIHRKKTENKLAILR